MSDDAESKPPVDPQRWDPPADPGLTGPYEKNDRLADSDLWPVPGTGPEDVVVTEDGEVYTGTLDGSIFRITEQGDLIRRVARTGGRPLGIELLPDGRLLVCDADRGLLAADPRDGAVEELVTEVEGTRLKCTNNAAVAPDGTIWFTNSSAKFTVHHYKGDLIEHSCTGQLFRRDPDGTVHTILDELAFPNGVTFDPDGDFLLMAETGRYRILRHWLAGDRQGHTDTFVEVPGFPDNLSTGPTGTIWCALASPRNKLLDTLFPQPPRLRKLMWSLPDAVQPAPDKTAIVFGFDRHGTVTHNLQWHAGEFIAATGVREHDGQLFIGSIESSAIMRHTL